MLPAHRGTGLGRLPAEAVIAAERAGFRGMRLDTLPSMAGALRKLGFEPIEPCYATPIAGTVLMARKLRPVGG